MESNRSATASVGGGGGTVARLIGGREGGPPVGTRETRHETREPDSYFIKEHNKGIDEDHLARFKPDKKEWKMDRIA